MVTRIKVKQMEDVLDKYIEDFKKYLNILLMEEYLSGLEFYFMPDGSLKMLGIVADNTNKTSVPYIALTDYTPLFADKITVNKI